MTNSFELETLAGVLSLLNGDTELTTETGIDPQTGAARSVSIVNTVNPDQPVPYIRVFLSDSLPLQDEPFQYTVIQAQTVSLSINVFSDYELETIKVTERVRALTENTPLSTANFTGSMWNRGITIQTQDTTNPTKVYYVAFLRLRCNMVAN